MENDQKRAIPQLRCPAKMRHRVHKPERKCTGAISHSKLIGSPQKNQETLYNFSLCYIATY